jgi:hypothetical protein
MAVDVEIIVAAYVDIDMDADMDDDMDIDLDDDVDIMAHFLWIHFQNLTHLQILARLQNSGCF